MLYFFIIFLGFFLKKFLLHLTAKASISALYDFALLKYFGSIQLTCFFGGFYAKILWEERRGDELQGYVTSEGKF
jgi:hypothetical protein